MANKRVEALKKAQRTSSDSENSVLDKIKDDAVTAGDKFKEWYRNSNANSQANLDYELNKQTSDPDYNRVESALNGGAASALAAALAKSYKDKKNEDFAKSRDTMSLISRTTNDTPFKRDGDISDFYRGDAWRPEYRYITDRSLKDRKKDEVKKVQTR